MSGYCGRGEAIGHAGELLQGALRRNGYLAPFLVTLPMPSFRSEAAACPAPNWSVRPHWKTKALRAAQAACESWNLREPAAIDISSCIPVGRGCGSSTADCVAAVRAVAGWAGVRTTAEEIANIVHHAEIACDPTMFDNEPVAFLPREGRVLRRLAPRWPALDVQVIDLGGTPVDTDASVVPSYSSAELEEFEGLLDLASAGFAAGDAVILARVATRSAEIHQRHRPHPAWSRLRDDALRRGAYGIAIAHSGTVAAILSGPATMRKEVETDVHLVGGRR